MYVVYFKLAQCCFIQHKLKSFIMMLRVVFTYMTYSMTTAPITMAMSRTLSIINVKVVFSPL